MADNISSNYTDDYYEQQVFPSLESARIVLTHSWKYVQPHSVLDVGCGRGAWLKACHELGSMELFGLDGTWNSQDAMIDSAIQFRAIDLNQPFAIDRKVDLAMSVEVAEHLEPSSSAPFVECLVRASDTVVFGAAYKGQNGPLHTNERRHSFWGGLFLEKGYIPFDLFRPSLWADERIQLWHRQNTFLYVKKESRSYTTLMASGLTELVDIGFMDCIHPLLFELRRPDPGFRDHVKQLVPSLLRAIRNKDNWG